MNRTPLKLALATALVASLALAGCKKKDETPMTDTTPVPASEPAPVATTPAPMPTTPPAPTAAVNVTSVDVGNAIGADNKVSTPMSAFAPKDTIYVSVATDGMATNVPVTAKWTYQDGQTVGTETKTLNASGPSVVEFHANKPSGWPAGTYKVEVSVNNMIAQTKDFTVK